MPRYSRPHRGNPYRDAYGQFCSRNVSELCDLARNSGLEHPMYVMRFVLEAQRQNMPLAAARMLTVESVCQMSGAPAWVISRARNRFNRPASITGAGMSMPTSTVYSLGLATGEEVRTSNGIDTAPSSRENRRREGYELLQASSADTIIDTPGILELVSAYANMTLWRVDTTNAEHTRYWFEMPNGDRFALLRRYVVEFLSLLGTGGRTDQQLYRWMDDYATDADLLSYRVDRLLDSARALGIPNYERGANITTSERDGYNSDDCDSLELYVNGWSAAAQQARTVYGDAMADCGCPECQFVHGRITYGAMLQERARIDGRSPVNPGALPSVASQDEIGIRVAPARPRRLPGLARTRAEGYYNDLGFWIEGRRPASHLRVMDNANDPRRYDYSDFLSAENFTEDAIEDAFADQGGYRSADQYGIRPWDYKAPLEFYGESAFGTFFGFENEINSNYENARIVNAVNYIGCAKWDGSVSGGFEIVSQPMSWDMIKDESFSWIPELRDAGSRAGRNGLHVHISRSGFVNDFHRMKFVKLWQDPNNYAEVKAFNRRHNTEYASPFQRLTNYRLARRIGVNDSSRYVMVNCMNAETIEMRGPASTLNRQKLRGTIGGFAAAVEYTRVMSTAQIALGALHWSAFVAWASERPEYAAFITYLEILVTEKPENAILLRGREMASL